MIPERILCVSVGCACLVLILAGTLYAVHMYRKGTNKNMVFIWICEVAVLIAVAHLAFTFPEFQAEMKTRAKQAIKTEGYMLTLNDREPTKKEKRKIMKKFGTYQVNGIYEDEKRVDLAPTDKSPIMK